MSTSNNHTDEYDPSDKRKNLRAPLIVMNVKAEEGQKTFFGYTKNISRSGMFIATANPRQPGTTFLVEIPFPSPLNCSIQCNCEVMWARSFSPKSPHDPGMGLRFLDIPQSVADQIDQWVAISLE